MALNLEVPPLPPQTLLLTVNAVERFWKLDQRSPVASEQAKTMLRQAENEIFRPLLTQTEPQDFERRFNELARKYADVRLDTLSILLSIFGPNEFTNRYFITLAKAFSRFRHAGESAGIGSSDLDRLERRYLKVAMVTATLGQPLESLDHEKLGPLLEAIIPTDFGITALALVFEGTIQSPLWRILETFRCTNNALSSYEQIIATLAGSKQASARVLGSLRVEGDLDVLLSEIEDTKPKSRKQ
jgi:hypothetical protein